MDLAIDPGVLKDLFPQIVEVIREPSANLAATFIMLAIVSILLMILVVVFGLVLTRRPVPKIRSVRSEPVRSSAPVTPQATPVPRRPRASWPVLAATAVFLVFGLWVITGITTSSRQMCESCHPDTLHVEAASSDPHRAVACVKCHEPGDAFDRVTFNIPGRVEHAISGYMAPTKTRSYGKPISSLGCVRCHAAIRAGTLVNKARGVRMSHKEPLAAGAECTDCHRLTAGILSRRTVGHDPCLRCHGIGKVSAECSACHTTDPAQAIRSADATEGSFAKRQVPTPTCSGCHTERACDTCHGIRMPHTEAFKSYGHARPGVIDLWENGGRTCARCHYAGNKPCSKCHLPFLSHGLTWKTGHKVAADMKGACACHDTRPQIIESGRSLCAICHDPAYRADQ